MSSKTPFYIVSYRNGLIRKSWTFSTMGIGDLSMIAEKLFLKGAVILCTVVLFHLEVH